MADEPPDENWVPDWLRGPIDAWNASTRGVPLEPLAGPNGTAQQGAPEQPKFTRRRRTVTVYPRRDRTVNRKLRGIHIFMISMNATLGTGLYWRGGQILELGGPLAVLLSFLLVGLLAWAAMQCMTEMLCIWPIPGALSVYVREFVDVELGIAVGVAYWFTYSVSFAGLIATAAAEIDFWDSVHGNKIFNGLVVYFIIPAFLIGVNSFGIEWYGVFEVFFGTTKLLFYLPILGALVAINLGTNGNHAPKTEYWHDLLAYDTLAAPSWGVCFLICISIALFAYVGVEVVVASALEARWPEQSPDSQTQTHEDATTRPSSAPKEELLIGKTVKFSSIYISLFATGLYILGGAFAASDMPRSDCRLPRLTWINSTASLDGCASDASASTNSTTSSAFVAIAEAANMPGLTNAFNVFLVFTAITCANTNLYVASRSLYGLTSGLDGGGKRGSPFVRVTMNVLAWFGRTNSRQVPFRAMIMSAFAFIWVPFLQLIPGGGTDATTPIGMFIEILAQMGSIGVAIVWACECLAFIRFYHCIYRHRAVLEQQNVPRVRRWDKDDPNNYPYRSVGQIGKYPVLGYFAFAGCIFVLLVCNGAALWNGWHLMPFLSSYLIILVFGALFVALKLFRGAKLWSPVDLDNEVKVLKKIRDLNDIR